MAHYTNGQKVGGGYYFHASSFEVEVVPNEGGHLKGGSYVKVPFPVLFVIVPLLGAMFLMFLPVAGFALVAYAAARLAKSLVTHGASDLAATVQPGGFATGAAYFTGKRDEAKAEGAPAKAPALDELEKEIAARKGAK